MAMLVGEIGGLSGPDAIATAHTTVPGVRIRGRPGGVFQARPALKRALGQTLRPPWEPACLGQTRLGRLITC